VIFEDLPDRGAFKIKTGGAGHVRENDLSMDKNYFNGKMGVIKSFESGNSCSFSGRQNDRSRKIRMAEYSI
jgi:hypothetical protein